MAKDYAVISQAIVDNIGGVDNIESVTHCMTRLRFVLKDNSKLDEAAVKAIDGVMGVTQQGGQFQVIIGNNVGKAYQEVMKLGNFGEGSEIARGEKKEPPDPEEDRQQHSGRHRGHDVPLDPPDHRCFHAEAGGHAAPDGGCAGH